MNHDRKTSELEILLSTMNRDSLSFLGSLFPGGNFSDKKILIINQTSPGKQLISNFPNIRVINSFEKGLSKSRNLAIENAKGDICLFADDDVSYEEDYERRIMKAYERYKEAHIVTFQMMKPDGKLYRDYPARRLHSRRTVSSVNSVVISFKREAIQNSKVRFNTLFGLGASFETGDEYIFLRDALKAKFTLCFEPVSILTHPAVSSGQQIQEDRIAFARAAIFYKYSGILGYLRFGRYLYLNVRNGNLDKSDFWPKYKTGLKGIKAFKNMRNQENKA